MGKDIHVQVFKKNRSSNTWEQIILYQKEKEKYNKINIYPYRNYELFGILNEEGEDDDFPCYSICTADLPEYFQNEINKFFKIPGCYGFHEINLADVKLYLLQHPKVRDYDYEGEDFEKNGWKDNPVSSFLKRIYSILDLYDPFWNFSAPLSDIRIIYWFDC